MSFDFSLILLIFSAITGVIWLLDSLLLRKPRDKKVASFLSEKGVSENDFRVFVNYLQTGEREDQSKDQNQEQDQITKFPNQKSLEEAYKVYQDPIVVFSQSFLQY